MVWEWPQLGSIWVIREEHGGDHGEPDWTEGLARHVYDAVLLQEVIGRVKGRLIKLLD